MPIANDTESVEHFVFKRLDDAARFKNVATPKQRDMPASLPLFGCLASPLQRPTDVEFKICAAANSDYAIGFSVSRSSRGSV